MVINGLGVSFESQNCVFCNNLKVLNIFVYILVSHEILMVTGHGVPSWPDMVTRKPG